MICLVLSKIKIYKIVYYLIMFGNEMDSSTKTNELHQCRVNNLKRSFYFAKTSSGGSESQRLPLARLSVVIAQSF